MNSFTARITSTNYTPGLIFPIWQLREALEEPPVEGPAMDCRVWVATEWIIRCAFIVFDLLNPKEEVTEHTARIFGTGSLIEDIQPLSVERWEYWKRRFFELAANRDGLGLGDTSVERISEALKSMEDIEG